ncbi:MAG: DUF1028 domain-containing protein [Natronospirillum sp.]|uniref:DUF1028 domain-containing protein n=1 Tax=Natronospirillum sp. TaxID=2812955 RepID=UPI0025F38E02|nr:DUF1028 domain-containing protein [Natronospirillum sp.]MCH8552464.1 DUF1028 domain-containing protein [Natronospirillum sp.]
MTYSIIAHDADCGAMGVATATGSVAVGGFVTHARIGAGVIATQGAFTNWLYGERGLKMLENGFNAGAVRDELIRMDGGSDYRQVVVCDRWGQTAGHTGSANLGQMAHHCEDYLAVAGNMLSDEKVLQVMQDCYLDHNELPMHERLLAALQAGEEAGGDFRGSHSASLKVLYPDQPPVDLRVDWADKDCTLALEAVYQKTRTPAFQGFLAGVPTPTEPEKRGQVSDQEVDQ